MVTFKEIVNDEQLLAAVEELGFTEPTEIQAATIPPGLAGRDLIGQAKTGSGKTFAFGIPILHNISRNREVQALILAPTRELCQQIAHELRKLAKHKGIRVADVYGGVSINPQIDDIDESQIVVGTPGRILDHLERDTLRTGHIKTFVLDEADRMFDMGFIDDIRRIADALPSERQTLLFSATMPDEIKALARKYQNDPVHIKTAIQVEEQLLPQYYYVVDRMRKFSLLVHLLRTEDGTLGIIFCATRHIADTIARNLERHGIRAESLHGGLSQSKRDQIVKEFRAGTLPLLIATDVAARGLDIKNVSHVFNYDVPKNPEDYIHRIGRTARAGESGKAITLLEDRDFEFFQGILELPNVTPTQLEAGDFRQVGFRKHEDGERQPNSYGERGPRRDGPRPERRERAPQRQEKSSGGYTGTPQHHEEKKPAVAHAGGWKQSRRAR